MWDFSESLQSRKNNPESLAGMFSIKGKAQYFFIVENTLCLKFR